MSEFQTPSTPPPLTVAHSAGFFSCTTIFLEHILDYFNRYHVPPETIHSGGMYTWYKMQHNSPQDIKTEYFLAHNQDIAIPPYTDRTICTTSKPIEQQYVHYQYLNYTDVTPFVKHYFSPSPTIEAIMSDLQDKYAFIPDRTCVLFYRGNDKAKETSLPSYEKYLQTAQSLLNTDPELRIWIQSDETEFLDAMKAAFPDNHVIFYDEIRHMPRNPQTTVDKKFYSQNYIMSKYYLAITYLMSQCKYVICGTGNCSLWIALFRGHNEGMTQFNYWVK